MVEAPVEQLLGLVGALLLRLEAVDHDDQAQSVLHRRPDEAVTGFLGEAGLEAVGSDRHGEQGIAVVLTDLVPGEFTLAVIFVVFGIGVDDVPRQLAELARGHQLSGIGKTVRIAEGGLGDRKSTRLNSSHLGISYAVFCLKKKSNTICNV